jgi:threonine dehydrogenase-like Zn-dependent dehydrogenase
VAPTPRPCRRRSGCPRRTCPRPRGRPNGRSAGVIEAGEIDPGFIISHRMSLEDAPKAYEIVKNKKDYCTKVVLTP